MVARAVAELDRAGRRRSIEELALLKHERRCAATGRVLGVSRRGLLGRRDWLLAAASCGLTAGTAAASALPSALRVEDIEVPGGSQGSLRARVLSPTAGKRPRRCLVLLHGLGETASSELGLKAWSHLYGLMDAHRRLAAPPVERNPKLDYFPQQRLLELNQSLQLQPYQPPLLVCPVTPRPPASGRAAAMDAYARWLVERLLPAVEQRHPGCAAQVGLDGCSMGGYVATEVLIRFPTAFTTFGVVQCAIGEWRVPGYVQALSRVRSLSPKLAIHLQTSSQDPFKAATTSLARGLERAGVPHRLEVFPGPHNQPWLREVGTLMMLRWHERHLRQA